MSASSVRRSGRKHDRSLSPYERDLLKGKFYLLIDASEVDPTFALVGVFSSAAKAITFTNTDPTTWHEVTDYWYEDSDRWRLTPMIVDEERRWARSEWGKQRTTYVQRERMLKADWRVKDAEFEARLWRWVDGRMGFEMLDLGISTCEECGDSGWSWTRTPNRMFRVRCPMCQGGA